MQIILFIGAGVCLLVAFIAWSVHYFDPEVCSKCGDHMSSHICGHLHCDNNDCDNVLK